MGAMGTTDTGGDEIKDSVKDGWDRVIGDDHDTRRTATTSRRTL